MAELFTLTASARAGTGTGAARAVRRAGMIPGILYGGSKPAQPIAVNAKELKAAVSTGRFTSTLLQLDLDGTKERVLPREVQLDPVFDEPLHVDLYRLEGSQRVRLSVPVRIKGQESSPGIKRGGVLNIVRHEIEFYCPPDNIPAFIEADIAAMTINDSLHISDITLPEGVRPVIQGRDFTIATVVAPSGLKEAQDDAASAEAAAAAAPAAGDKKAPAAGGAAPAKAAAAPAKK